MFGAVSEPAFLDQAFDRAFDFAFFVEETKLLRDGFWFKGLIIVATDKVEDLFFQVDRFIHVKSVDRGSLNCYLLKISLGRKKAGPSR